MKPDARKFERITDFVPVEVFITERKSGNTVAGPFNAMIVDICRDGLGLLMSQVQSGTFHIFHSTKEDKDLYLQIMVHRPPHHVDVHFAGLPVWLNTFENDEFEERMIGVRFLDQDNDDESGNIDKLIHQL